MAYVGNSPEKGNFRKADQITCSATATYNLLVGGVAVNPNQNQCIVSLNGVVQSSGTSFTIASSQITFASALTSSDVIDFILILGDTLDVGVPSDDTVDASKITANVITGQSALGATPADTDELLISDAGTLKRVDYSHLKSSVVNRINAQPFLNNGGFEISQRSGTTATSFVNNTYGLDRWKNYLNGSCALNYQQLGQASSIVTNLQSTSGINYTNCLYLDCTTAASLGGSDLLSVLQLMEGYVHNPLAGKAMTLSFWVRSSVTGTYCVAFKEGSTKTYVVEYTISSADTWEQKIINITNDTLANYNTNTSVTTGSSLQVNFTLRLGTVAQQTSAGAWNSGNFYGTSNQVTWGTSTSHDFYLAGVQLEEGTYTSSTLPPFQHESYGDNLARCQRYFQLPKNWWAYSDTYTATSWKCYHDFPVIMRAAPTLTASGTPTVNKMNANAAGPNSISTPGSANVGGFQLSFTIVATGTGSAAATNTPYQAYDGFAASADF